MRLGVYSDLVYRADADGLSNNRAFIRFVHEPAAARRGGRAVRAPAPRAGPQPVRDPRPRASGSCRCPTTRASPPSARWSALVRRSGAVFARRARPPRRGVGVRPAPDGAAVRRHRARGGHAARPRRPPGLPALHRRPSPGARLGAGRSPPPARSTPRSAGSPAPRRPSRSATSSAARYAGGRAPVLSTGFSLVRQAELADPGEAPGGRGATSSTLLSVGRLDPEKNPLLLRRRDRRAARGATRAGGSWRPATARCATSSPRSRRARPRADAVELPGEVPNGPALWDLYRRSHVVPARLVHRGAAAGPLRGAGRRRADRRHRGRRGAGRAGRREHRAADRARRRRRRRSRRSSASRTTPASAAGSCWRRGPGPAQETLEAQRDRVVDVLRGLARARARAAGARPGPGRGPGRRPPGRAAAAKERRGAMAAAAPGERQQQPEVALEGERQE